MPQMAAHGTCVHACSACFGDYEDPERSAWGEATDEEGGDPESAGRAPQSIAGEEFPVREE
jgi:hypothetical protein